MGQLIKLQDYISRYEIDTYRYPGQFIRLKKQQWEKVKDAWENGSLPTFQSTVNQSEQIVAEEKRSLFQFIKKRTRSTTEVEIEQLVHKDTDEPMEDSEFSISYQSQPTTIDELKQVFLNHIFDFQMKWASSTVREKSYVDKGFYFDSNLKYFLQRFPDTYLLLYKPIFLLKKAPIEVEVILISPTITWCITILEGKENSVFVGANDRFWIERNGKNEKKILNPLIGLNRMERIVRKIFSLYEVEMPIRKIILNRTGYIDFPLVPYDTEIIEKKNYEVWFRSLRNVASPLKHMQLKAAYVLLQYCQTTYVRRMD
ncbi:NERD domain-containing protein [Fredinandcohnia humi]